MNLKQIIEKVQPYNEQEQKDKELMLHELHNNKDLLLRSNTAMHFTASAWIVNPKRTKVLMIYHKIYDSWSWCGGHADGDEDLLAVAQKEIFEECGLTSVRLTSKIPFSIEVLTVDGHIKKGLYVSSHLHLNVTYLFEADENETLILNEEETAGICWFDIKDVEKAVSEQWMMDHIYKKLLQKMKEEK